MKSKTTLVICLIMLLMKPSFGQGNRAMWIKTETQSIESTQKAKTWATNYIPFTLNVDELKNYLSAAPFEQNINLKSTSFIISLPRPDGSYADFKIIESPVMEQGLADAYPQIKTYAGQGIDDPAATVRFDVTQFGLHAMVISPNGTYLIDPIDLNTSTEYVSYYKRDALPHNEMTPCLFSDKNEEQTLNDRVANVASAQRTINGQLRTYRLALAADSEYCHRFGGTIVGSLAAMVTCMNRVNGVYEREFGIHMNIIANDTLLIFIHANDPYTNNSGGTMLGQNQTTCDGTIGTANYDMGHVFSTGGGGIAGLGVICRAGNKARGVTGLPNPTGDAFYIDFVAHEMGHQFGGNHTFNCETSNCGGNRASGAAYEPGSASTIMGYAGICAPNDLQSNSDDYFHTKSFDEIITYSQTGSGNACAVLTTTSNLAPVLTLPPNRTIPLGTPFRLTASATDPDGDPVTFCWEEFDLGAAGTWNAPVGNAPIFRSFDPTTSATRLFPKLTNILANTTTIGEIKPSYARSMIFRCTLRDNVLSGAGVTYSTSAVTITVASSGPFAVLTPNVTGISWTGGTTQTVTWSVNGTTAAPVSAANVNVLLSVDGGTTFPTILGTAVPNNGTYSFTCPNVSTSTARVMVEGAGNIFFDINDKNFTITPLSVQENAFSASINVYPNPTNDDVSFSMINEERGNVELTVTDYTGRIVKTFSLNKIANLLQLNLDMNKEASGIYFVKFKSEKSEAVKSVVKM